MFSLQRVLGKEDQFFDLLEASAREGLHAVNALKQLLASAEPAPSLNEFSAARRKDKEITNQLEEMLIHTFVTALEREDIEALAERLYKIPKTIEKFAERYCVAPPQVRDSDFSRQVHLIERAVQTVVEMVHALARRDLAALAGLQNQLQDVESEADDVLLEYKGQFYQPGFPPLKAVILTELFDLNEKVVDRCRDAGNVIARVVMKNE